MLKPSISAISTSNQQYSSQLDAVIIRNLIYEVGRGKNRRRILNQINLTVPEGSIYGLLGPSGCGKTTMLRCVVGRLKWHNGSVLVFGLRPDEGSSEVPGRDVGYMPQEISIYEDFTIEETLRFFGKINRMQDKAINKRIEFLLQFLDLPSKKRLVSNLSGGQKRRVSLAAALVHSPPLLILDEPTVGVDPLLRQSIWKHLVSLTKTEKISVIITTHYIEEARQANVVGLMRHGKILAEDQPDNLMQSHGLNNLEDVFLKLCVTDSSRHAASLAGARQLPTGKVHYPATATKFLQFENDLRARPVGAGGKATHSNATNVLINSSAGKGSMAGAAGHRSTIVIRTHSNEIELDQVSQHQGGGYVNEVAENFSSEDDDDDEDQPHGLKPIQTGMVSHRELAVQVSDGKDINSLDPSNYQHFMESKLKKSQQMGGNSPDYTSEDYLASQAMKWASRRANELSLLKLNIINRSMPKGGSLQNRSSLVQWWLTLMAVTWKNYTRLRRNPPVLIFQFMLPAIQVILFCLCIGGEPFDVPVAIVNDEVVPRSSLQFLNGLNKKIIRQIKYDNLTSAKEAVRKGHVWGAIHIPDKYSQNLQSRLIMGEDVTNETISNGTIRVYPDLTNLHLALALETTFRETFVNFAKDSLDEMGYDRSLADLPIQIGQPIYGTLRKDSYLEFMAPGVVISICYVMATGLTALAFILERRDGLLERSLVSGVQTSQILLAHAINQVVVMIIQIFMVLGCIFIVFEIPSRGPFFWVVLLILLQGCTGMGFGLLVSAICKEENTAVMMVVGTFYTNLILAGIIWPIEAMPHWLRPLSYAQPQTLPTDTLRHILSRGWGINETGVIIGFAVTIGWLLIFLMAAGVIFKYSR